MDGRLGYAACLSLADQTPGWARRRSFLGAVFATSLFPSSHELWTIVTQSLSVQKWIQLPRPSPPGNFPASHRHDLP